MLMTFLLIEGIKDLKVPKGKEILTKDFLKNLSFSRKQMLTEIRKICWDNTNLKQGMYAINQLELHKIRGTAEMLYDDLRIKSITIQWIMETNEDCIIKGTKTQ